jgi:RimJ/RimL family protein N-acetyltransferase
MRRGITDFTIPKLKENTVEYKWFTSWLIVHLADNVYIGALGANGLPDEKGEVIIGYFVERKYDGQGFATEATGLFANHLLQDSRLKQVAATIPIGHSASEKVVEKNGFIIECQLEEEGMQLNKWALKKG